MTESDTRKLVEETAQYFVERLPYMSPVQSAATRRNTQRAQTLRAYQRHFERGLAEQWIAAMEDATLAGRANYDAELRDIAAHYVKNGQAVPAVLRRYTRKVLEGSFQPKQSKQGKHIHDNLTRDIVIAERVHSLSVTQEISALAACSIVVQALKLVSERESRRGRLQGVRAAIGYEAVRTIWKTLGKKIARTRHQETASI